MAEAIAVVDNSRSVENFINTQFDDYPTDLRYQKVTFHTAYPLNSLKNGKIINFTLPAWNAPAMYMLGEAWMTLTLKLTKPDGSSPPDTTPGICTINMPLSTIFSDMKMQFNETSVNSDHQNYGYRCIMQTILNANDAYKNTVLEMAGYAKDESGMMDERTSKNPGFDKRWARFVEKTNAGGTTYSYDERGVKFTGRLISDFTGGRYNVPSGVAVKIEFTLASQEFVMLAPKDEYKFSLEDFTLKVPCGHLSDKSALRLETRLSSKPLKITLRRCVVQNHNIGINSPSWTTDSLFNGSVLPSRVVIAFVKAKAYGGDYLLNPFNFETHFSKTVGTVTTESNIKSVKAYLNGESIDGFSLNLMDDYVKMFDLTGQMETGTSNGITATDFTGGYGFFMFDFSTSRQSYISALNPAIRVGNIRIVAEFTDNTLHPLTAVVFTEAPSTITIDQKRQVATDFLS